MSQGNLFVRGGRVVDPATSTDGLCDVLIQGGKVEAIGPGIQAPDGIEIFEAKGLVVCPGLIDIHVHFREPGQEYKETVATGVASALSGGFTGVCTMPNTDPVVDEASVVEFQLSRSREAGGCRVYPIGAVTKGQKGEELAEMGEMLEAGAVAFSDDGFPVWNTAIMRRALEYTSDLGVPVIQHAEDPYIKGNGVMNEGAVSSCLGLPGIHVVGEAACVARDLLLLEVTGGKYHVAHLSGARTLELVREAKKIGLPVTCEVSPHHLLLTDEECRSFDPNTKMNPPLRTQEDLDVLVEALADGTIDCVATDHAPHAPLEKQCEFSCAPFGIVGLETAVPLLLDRLVRPGHLTLEKFVEVLSTKPAEILGLPGGRLAPGEVGDLTILDLGKRTTVDPSEFHSKSRNSPFSGWELEGAPVATIVAGEVRWGG